MSMEKIQQQLTQLYVDHAVYCAPSGYRSWDRLTGGLARSGLTLIGGRPAMGKTSLAFNIVSRVSQKNEGAILIFSPVHRESDVCTWLLQIGMGMHTGRLFDGSLPPAEATERCNALFTAQKSRIRVINITYLTLNNIYEICRRTPNLQMVVVDNIESIIEPIHYDDWNTNTFTQKEPLKQVLRELKHLAWHYDIPVVCTVNMHRSLEKRKNKRPKLQDLEKIQIPADLADQVVFLYRDSYYCYESDNTAECIIARTPYGQTGTVSLQWYPVTGEFTEPED